MLRSSLISLLVAFAGIAVYISVRYDGRYAVLALVALGHDVLIVCGSIASALKTLLIGMCFLGTFSCAFIGIGLFLVFLRSLFTGKEADAV